MRRGRDDGDEFSLPKPGFFICDSDGDDVAGRGLRNKNHNALVAADASPSVVGERVDGEFDEIFSYWRTLSR